MKTRIRELILSATDPEKTPNRQAKQIATFIGRPNSYISYLNHPRPGGNLAPISDAAITAAFFDLGSPVTEKERKFSLLVCWLCSAISEDPVNDKVRLFEFLKGKKLGYSWVRFAEQFDSNLALADAAWPANVHLGRRVTPLVLKAKDTEGPAETEPKQDEKVDKPADSQSQVIEPEDTGLLPGIPGECETPDIPVELWAEMVEYLKRDACANKGLFSISAAYNRFKDRLSVSRTPHEFLRRNETKEQIEMMAKLRKVGNHSIPRDQKVDGIPDITEVIYNCDIRGWCVCEELFLDYAMFISKEFKFVAFNILRQAADKTPSTSGVLTEERVVSLVAAATKPMFEMFAGTMTAVIREGQQAAEERTNKKLEEVTKTQRVLKASQDRDRNLFLSSVGYSPLGFYTKKHLQDGLRTVLRSKLFDVAVVPEAVITNLVEYLTVCSLYIECWLHTPNLASLTAHETTGLIPFDALDKIDTNCTRPPSQITLAGVGAGYVMCITPTRKKFSDAKHKGISYDRYHAPDGFGWALSALIPRMVYTSEKQFVAHELDLWCMVTKGRAVIMDKAIYEYFRSITEDSDKLRDFMDCFRTACRTQADRLVVAKNDPFDMHETCLEWRRLNQPAIDAANKCNE